MSDDAATEAEGSRITYFGLFIALFAITAPAPPPLKNVRSG